jgi:hypothetical protein
MTPGELNAFATGMCGSSLRWFVKAMPRQAMKLKVTAVTMKVHAINVSQPIKLFLDVTDFFSTQFKA